MKLLESPQALLGLGTGRIAPARLQPAEHRFFLRFQFFPEFGGERPFWRAKTQAVFFWPELNTRIQQLCK